MKLDVNSLTLGEVAKIESLSGMGLAAVADASAPQGKLLAALVFVQSRRQGQPKTWDACLDMPMSEAHEYLGIGQDDEADEEAAEDPTPPARSPRKRKS